MRHESARDLRLTEDGNAIACAVVRRHRLVETFLHRTLGMPWDQVHEEAELLGHAVSARLEAVIDAALGHPARDPHGDPIRPVQGEQRERSGELGCVSSRTAVIGAGWESEGQPTVDGRGTTERSSEDGLVAGRAYGPQGAGPSLGDSSDPRAEVAVGAYAWVRPRYRQYSKERGITEVIQLLAGAFAGFAVQFGAPSVPLPPRRSTGFGRPASTLSTTSPPR